MSQTPPEPPIRDSAASLGDVRSHLCPTRRLQGPRDVGIGRRHHLRPRNRLKIDMWKLLPPRLAEYLLNQRISLKNWMQTRKVELKGFHLRPRSTPSAKQIMLFDGPESCGTINGHEKYLQIFRRESLSLRRNSLARTRSRGKVEMSIGKLFSSAFRIRPHLWRPMMASGVKLARKCVRYVEI